MRILGRGGGRGWCSSDDDEEEGGRMLEGWETGDKVVVCFGGVVHAGGRGWDVDRVFACSFACKASVPMGANGDGAL